MTDINQVVSLSTDFWRRRIGNVVTISGNANNAVKLQVRINGQVVQTVNRATNGTLQISVSHSFMRASSNTVELRAYNAAGARQSVTRTVTITPFSVNNLVVYQSPRRPGRDESACVNLNCNHFNCIAEDMRFNNYSQIRLRNVHPMLGAQAEIYNWPGGSNALQTQALTLTIAFTNNGTMRALAASMFNHVFSGHGGNIQPPHLSERTRAHNSSISFINTVHELIRSHILANSGNPLHAINDARINNALHNVRPQFKESDDYWNGLMIMLHDTWGSRIYLRNFEFDGLNFSGNLRFMIYDHFGLDTDDVTTGDSRIDWNPAFASWYVLQHFSSTGGRYRPFINWLVWDVPMISGKVQ